MSRPHISLNFAISADAKISTRNGDASGWTSDADKARYLEIRREADAIMVGRGTQEADNMSLTLPDGPQPLRIIVSYSGHFDLSSKVFQTPGGPLHLIVTDPDSDISHLRDLDATIHHSSLKDALPKLGVDRILCEGGGQLTKQLAQLDLIDCIHLTWAGHHLIGGKNVPTITGQLGDFLPSSRSFRLEKFTPSGADKECFLTYTRDRSA